MFKGCKRKVDVLKCTSTFVLYRLMVDTDSLQVPLVEAMHAFVYFHLMVPSQLM